MNRTNLIFIILLGILILSLAGCTTTNNTANNAPTSIPNTNINTDSTTNNNIMFNTSVSIGASKAIPAATSGHLYNAKIIITGGDPPYNCSAEPSTKLPGALVFSEPGCSITGTAPILSSGTPTAVYQISFIVRDSKGNIGGPFHLELVVNQQVAKLKLPESINTATIGEPYEYNFCDPSTQSRMNCGHLASIAEGLGNPPFTFTISGQPLSLSISSNGILTGTIPEGAFPNEYTITVCVRDIVGSEACADTILPVIKKLKPKVVVVPPIKPPVKSLDCPYEGIWKGSVSATGNMDVGYSGDKKAYSVSFDLEVTMECEEYTDDSGENAVSYDITRIKASDPFFECADGCEPIAGDSNGRLTYINIYEDGTPGQIAIRFPNDALIQGTHTLLNSDGNKIVDEINWPPYVAQSIAWKVGSGQQIETYNCNNCGSAYPDHTRIELTKVD